MIGWNTLWQTYRACLEHQGIDVTIPDRLPELLAATAAYENIVTKVGNIPVGFWPQGELTYNALLEYSLLSTAILIIRPIVTHSWSAPMDGL